MRRVVCTLLFTLGAAVAAAGDPPRRIVSINLLTDQWLLTLAPREKVSSVTFLSQDPNYSPLWRQAREIPANHGTAEEVLRFKPDLVLAGRYAATETVALLERLGVRVVVFDYASDFEGIAAQAREIGDLIGEPGAAKKYADSMLARLERVRAQRPARPPHILEYEQNGWTHGSGSTVDMLLREAGAVNAAAEHGVAWMAQLPLEEVVRMHPDGFIAPRRNEGAPSLAGGVFEHEAFRAISARGLVITMPPGTTDFGGPSTIDALEYLAAKLREPRNQEK